MDDVRRDDEYEPAGTLEALDGALRQLRRQERQAEYAAVRRVAMVAADGLSECRMMIAALQVEAQPAKRRQRAKVQPTAAPPASPSPGAAAAAEQAGDADPVTGAPW